MTPPQNCKASPTIAPPHWPAAGKPLRVLLIGWARLAYQGRQGSGYNFNLSELARGLVLSGHRVWFLQSGMGFSLGPLGPLSGVAEPRIRHREDWAGVGCFELLNAANVAPSAWNFGNVSPEMADPASSQLVRDFALEHRFDVVHIHSQEGLGFDLIPTLKSAGIPVVVTLHNYYYLCPQVDLLYQEREVCTDYQGGRRCESCLAIQNVAQHRKTKAVGSTLEYLFGLYRADVIRKTAYGILPTLKKSLRGRILTRFAQPHHAPERLLDLELAAGFTIDQTDAADPRIRHDYTLEPYEQPKDYARLPMDLNERMLTDEAIKVNLKVLNPFGERRAAGIHALKQADIVTAPSDYLRRVHVAMGLNDRQTRCVRLGMPHFDQIHRAVKRSPFYDVSPWNPGEARRPLRFCFLGAARPNKGLEVLTRAIALLEPAVRARCHITIHASGNDWSFRKRLSEFPQVSVYPGYDHYQLIAKQGEFDIGVLPHIWLENSPLVLLEFLHAGKFVISSRLGGPVEWIQEGRNGLLFPSGDEGALARLISGCVTGLTPIPSPRQVHEASLDRLQSFPGHIQEVQSLYASLNPGQR